MQKLSERKPGQRKSLFHSRNERAYKLTITLRVGGKTFFNPRASLLKCNLVRVLKKIFFFFRPFFSPLFSSFFLVFFFFPCFLRMYVLLFGCLFDHESIEKCIEKFIEKYVEKYVEKCIEKCIQKLRKTL